MCFYISLFLFAKRNTPYKLNRGRITLDWNALSNPAHSVYFTFVFKLLFSSVCFFLKRAYSELPYSEEYREPRKIHEGIIRFFFNGVESLILPLHYYPGSFEMISISFLFSAFSKCIVSHR